MRLQRGGAGKAVTVETAVAVIVAVIILFFSLSSRRSGVSVSPATLFLSAYCLLPVGERVVVIEGDSNNTLVFSNQQFGANHGLPSSNAALKSDRH